jgi:predicted nucleic acid-binding protein
MARKPIFDTCVFSDYADYVDKIILSVLFPTIVLYELAATSVDESSLKKYERWRVLLNKNDCLINPTASDWWETAKSIRRLYLMQNAQPTKIKTLRNDALISRLAVIHDGFVVTHDVDDFQIIQKVMPDLKIISAKEFFES